MAKVRHDKLIAALIAKLPSPADGTAQWRQEHRITWLQMMAMAFDAVYGRCGGIAIAATTDTALPGVASAPPVPPGSGEAGPQRPRRFYVDHDGFAMSDGRPIGIDDLPANAVLWDERSGIDRGDPAAILWRDIGASRQSLPPGVMLKAGREAA
jgi:hypothetical protein